jgi:small subunit ribosomal protein S1
MTISTNNAPKQVAINDIGSAEELLAEIEKTLKSFNDGDLIAGIVVKIDRDEVLLDVGYKTEGVIPSRELSIRHDAAPGDIVSVGDVIEALVLQKEDKEGRLILSKKRAQYERAWGDVEKIKETDGVVTGLVIEVVKGGLIVDIGLRGFLPASLIELRRVRDLSPYLGQNVDAKILELDKNRNNVVLSRRALLEESQSANRSTFLADLAKGQIRTGVVSSIVNFGAFIDLGGVDGLVHVSELSWKHIEHASEVVEIGQEVTVEVLEVDQERERVSLSLKATQEDPWQVFARTHAIGQYAPGKVTKIVPFGAFVRVADGIEGLVHISELSAKHIDLASQVVTVNQDVFVKVIDIDLERRRISLSLKQATEEVNPEGTDFNPALYGLATDFDDQGNYKYPEGFNSATSEWKPGFEEAKAKWEKEYAEANSRWMEHKKQVKAANELAATLPDAKPEVQAKTTTSSSSEGSTESEGTLSDDEALSALRDKLNSAE